MKKILYFLFWWRFKRHFVALCATQLLTLDFSLQAQAPQGIPYQAIARNASGVAIANTAVKVRFSIRDSIATGAIKYQETHNPTTSALGLFSVNLGMGTVVSGTFSGINWGKNAKFLQVEMDPAGGSSYTDLGTTQMMSVPYALYAGSAISVMKSFAFDTLIVFQAAGIFNWTAPLNVNKVMIECWGAGGGGEREGVHSSGGGGGGYAKGIYRITPGAQYQVIIGAGGGGQNNNPYGSNNEAGDGGASSFGTLISAQGGFSGTLANKGLGGDGFGQFNIKGGDGFELKNQLDYIGVGIQTRAGVSPSGGSSGRFGGLSPGGGGASGCCGANAGFGGAPGRVVIWY